MPDENSDVLVGLASDYLADLAILRKLDTILFTESVKDTLESLMGKYRLDEELTERTSCRIRGMIMAEINERLERLGIEHVLERQKEKDPSKLPKKSGEQKTRVDKGDFDGDA